MEEKLVKRTVWTVKCKCEYLDITYHKNAPREVYCERCREWYVPVQHSWTGKDEIGK